MVVMAIIAILATAGLSAYTGYIKKARDATRISDLRAINTIAIASMSTSGTYPTLAQLKTAILAANNNVPLLDPLQTTSGSAGKAACITYGGSDVVTGTCNYIYQTFSSGMGYRLGALLESTSNKSLYEAASSAMSYTGAGPFTLTNLAYSTCTTTSAGGGVFYQIQDCVS